LSEKHKEFFNGIETLRKVFHLVFFAGMFFPFKGLLIERVECGMDDR